MEEIKQKIDLIREAIDDYKQNKLSSFSAFVAISLIINPQPDLNPKMVEWAGRSIRRMEEDNGKA